jgi:hypothetical protein
MPRKASVNNSRALESLFIRLPNGELSTVGWLAINLNRPRPSAYPCRPTLLTSADDVIERMA